MRATPASSTRSATIAPAPAPAAAVQPKVERERRRPSGLSNQTIQHLLRAHMVQAKLALSEPGDELEREADETAESVLRMAAPAVPTHGHGPGGARIQPKCAACGGAAPAPEAKCPACEAKERGVQRKPAGNATGSAASALVPGPGALLSHEVRAFFEPRFQRDFGDVRVHADRNAATAAQSLDALAYTSGRDIVFGEGQYAPGTTAGRRLLAHELTHVVQQTGTAPRSGGAGDSPHLSAPSGAAPVQRLVRRSLLNGCGAGQNPFAADRRASTLLTNAIDRIDTAQAERAADAADPDVVAIGNAMRTAFRLDPATDDNWNLPAPRFGLPLVRRRLEAARDYIDSVVFTFNCCPVGGVCPATCGTCTATEEAFVCAGEASTITLCPTFFTRGANQRGRTLAHEVMHITFGFIRDWDQPDRTNAHCYAQFTALANDFNSPAGFRCH